MANAASLFMTLKKANRLLEVDMDDVKVLWPGSNKTAIGTQGLNGCTCVVIVGRAILLAHISPLPGRYEEWREASQHDINTARYNYHEGFIRKIAKLVQDNQLDFPASDTACGIFAQCPDGSIESVQQQIRDGLTSMGFSMRLEYYRDIDVKTHRSPKGELVCLFRSGMAELYLERSKIWPVAPHAHQDYTMPQQTLPALQPPFTDTLSADPVPSLPAMENNQLPSPESLEEAATSHALGDPTEGEINVRRAAASFADFQRQGLTDAQAIQQMAAELENAGRSSGAALDEVRTLLGMNRLLRGGSTWDEAIAQLAAASVGAGQADGAAARALILDALHGRLTS